MKDVLNELRKDEGLAQAIEALERCKSDPKLRVAALSREMSLRSYYSNMDSAHKQGLEEGRESGLKEGEVRGQLQMLLELFHSEVLTKEVVQQKMGELLGKGYDEEISEFLGKLS